MLAWANKKLEQLLDSLVDPLWTRILALHWSARLAILAFCAAALAMGLHWKETQNFLAFGFRIAATAFSNGQEGVPLSGDYLRRAEDGIARIGTSLEADLPSSDKPFGQELGVWAPAQLAIALKGYSLNQRDKLASFLHSRADPSCSCWREFPGNKTPRHILVSGWVLLALAHLNSAPSPDAVRFLIGVQNDEGWWPMFLYPKPDNRENASTYATAFSLLALNELLSRNLIAPENVGLVNETIRRGRSWLVSHRSSGQARWGDYPLSDKKKISQSISGLVIYTLHRLGNTSLGDLDRQWLTQLPDSPPLADACEISLVWSITLDGYYQDHNCQLPLAWVLAATVDAYPSGTSVQKAKAIAWVERVLDETNILHSETLPDNWKRAENLISLRHLVGAQGMKSGGESGGRTK